ncbi:MAG: iron chelate uptake ABC transporter family permease subunit [Bacteroidetes bacterium]|nr:iron chelate uptake ABC transporter family permease subunit [Bacteroidota bacterium]
MLSLKELLHFLSLSEPNIRYVVFGTIMVGIAAAVIGNFTFLRKRALVGDAIAHAVLPGICLAFMLQGSRSLWVLLPGAFVSGWLALLSIDWINRNSRLKPDAAIGLVLSVFFGTGVLLLTYIQQSGDGSQSGLKHFLFGQAAAILPGDLWVFGLTGLLLCGLVALFFKEFTLLSFDPDFAQAAGLPVRRLELLLSTLTVLAVVTGIQTVGVVLMAALLITPAAAARFWTDRLGAMVLLGAAFAALASVLGSFVSYQQPNMPTGPWIIVVLSAIAFFSMVFAPRRGGLARLWDKLRHAWKIREENVLKTIYHSGESLGDFTAGMHIEAVQGRRAFNPWQLRLSLFTLQRRGLLQYGASGYRLSGEGLREGARLARIHRLWELYLTEYLRLAPDHVHDDAEAMEHLITPELEAQLEAALGYPERDPHDRDIPR